MLSYPVSLHSLNVNNMETQVAAQVRNENATAAFAPVALLQTGYSGSTIVVLHSVAEATNAANINTLNRVYAPNSVTGGGTFCSKYVPIASNVKIQYNTKIATVYLNMVNFEYPHPSGPHSSRVMASGPASPRCWLAIAANVVRAKICVYVWRNATRKNKSMVSWLNDIMMMDSSQWLWESTRKGYSPSVHGNRKTRYCVCLGLVGRCVDATPQCTRRE